MNPGVCAAADPVPAPKLTAAARVHAFFLLSASEATNSATLTSFACGDAVPVYRGKGKLRFSLTERFFASRSASSPSLCVCSLWIMLFLAGYASFKRLDLATALQLCMPLDASSGLHTVAHL